MKKNRLICSATALALSVAAVALLANLNSRDSAGGELHSASLVMNPKPESAQTNSSGPSESGKPEAEMPNSEQAAAAMLFINACVAEFRALDAQKVLNPEQREAAAQEILARLRAGLRDLPADQAAAAILAFLDSGVDAATGLTFSLDGGGILADAPSLRTALLDLLGQLDPGAAVSYAQVIFNNSQIADEWALALRNLGWQNSEGAYAEEMRRRLTQMLDHQDWLAHPTNGFFEAFDVAVHLGTSAEFSAMASVLRLVDENGIAVENGSTHAAYLALDRMTVRNPQETLRLLTENPDLLAWAPEHRASLLARADLRDPAQLRLVETYLSTLAGRPEELATFTAMFPNRNGSLGNALVTTTPSEPTFRDLMDGDRAALDILNGWIASGRYSSIDTNLREISSRLGGMIAAANQ